jgi:hypothetical protein
MQSTMVWPTFRRDENDLSNPLVFATLGVVAMLKVPLARNHRQGVTIMVTMLAGFLIF